MRRAMMTLAILVISTAGAWGQRMTEAQERARLPKLLEWAKGQDPPSRHTAFVEMTAFGKWLDPILLGKLNGASDEERLLFLIVLRHREVVRVRDYAQRHLEEAVVRCERAQVAVAKVAELRRIEKKKTGSDADTPEIAAARRQIPWREITEGTEVAVLCDILQTFGREDALELMAKLAIRSGQDKTLAVGFVDERTHSRQGKIMYGGTAAWNQVYNNVWEALVTLSHRSLKKRVIETTRQHLTRYFDTLAKHEDRLNPNQEAALKRWREVKDALWKTETTSDTGEATEEDNPDVGIIRK